MPWIPLTCMYGTCTCIRGTDPKNDVWGVWTQICHIYAYVCICRGVGIDVCHWWHPCIDHGSVRYRFWTVLPVFDHFWGGPWTSKTWSGGYPDLFTRALYSRGDRIGTLPGGSRDMSGGVPRTSKMGVGGPGTTWRGSGPPWGGSRPPWQLYTGHYRVLGGRFWGCPGGSREGPGGVPDPQKRPKMGKNRVRSVIGSDFTV